MTKFKGRVLIAGQCKGPALVSKTGFNPLATFNRSLLDDDGTCVCYDNNNKDLYGKSIKSEIICLPQAVGSTTAGFLLQSVAAKDLQPKAMLFARPCEPLILAGIIVADVLENKQIITIDGLGDDFLESVKEGDIVEVLSDGTVIVNN